MPDLSSFLGGGSAGQAPPSSSSSGGNSLYGGPQESGGIVFNIDYSKSGSWVPSGWKLVLLVIVILAAFLMWRAL